MKLLIIISLRNLLRQKQRNILLGIGIAFGMSILIMANAFSHGLSDILLNRVIKLMTGHFIISVREKPEDKTRMLIRDKNRFERIIRENVQGDLRITEQISTQTGGLRSHSMNQALGNGGSSIIVVVGVERHNFMDQDHEVVSGRVEDIWDDTEKENPILIYDSIAENLNVKLNDSIRVRFSTVYGQVQAARFTVVCILKSVNPFMSVAAFTSQETLKPLIGLEPQETSFLSVVIENLDDPTKVIEQARHLHEALKPGTIGFEGRLIAGAVSETVRFAAINPDKEKQREFIRQIQLKSGATGDIWADSTSALISERLARRLNVGVGDRLTFTYPTKFEGMSEPRQIAVGGIYLPNGLLREEMAILNPELINSAIVPAPPGKTVGFDDSLELQPFLMKEWRLLEISPDRDSLLKNLRKLDDEDWKGQIVNVSTMYAIASEVLKMEGVLKMISLAAVLILFFIILIGVINTLRMTIRERTREIGTVRAIGMQRSDVRRVFLLEVVFLSLFAAAAGIVLSLILMKLSTFITLKPEGMFSIFLVNHHLHFLPTVSNVIANLAIIVIISAATAIIPAHRASRMSVADALRHIE